MPGSDHIQVPVEALQAISTSLSSMEAELDGTVLRANHVSGTDDVHGHLISMAISSYVNEWSDPRSRLIRNVGKLGEVSGKIAETTASFDDESAKGFEQFAAQLQEGASSRNAKESG